MSFGKFSKKIKISVNSAFKPWEPPKKINFYKIFMDLVESNEIKITRNKKVLTPFEGALWLENLELKIVNGVIKIINKFFIGYLCNI